MRVSVLTLIIPTAVLAVAIDKENLEQEGDGVVGYFKNMWLSKRNILYRYHNHDSWNEDPNSWRLNHHSWNDVQEDYPDEEVYPVAAANPPPPPSPKAPVIGAKAPVIATKPSPPVSYSVTLENGNYVYRPVYSSQGPSPDLALFPDNSPFAKNYPGFQPESEELFA